MDRQKYNYPIVNNVEPATRSIDHQQQPQPVPKQSNYMVVAPVNYNQPVIQNDMRTEYTTNYGAVKSIPDDQQNHLSHLRESLDKHQVVHQPNQQMYNVSYDGSGSDYDNYYFNGQKTTDSSTVNIGSNGLNGSGTIGSQQPQQRPSYTKQQQQQQQQQQHQQQSQYYHSYDAPSYYKQTSGYEHHHYHHRLHHHQSLGNGNKLVSSTNHYYPTGYQYPVPYQQPNNHSKYINNRHHTSLSTEPRTDDDGLANDVSVKILTNPDTNNSTKHNGLRYGDGNYTQTVYGSPTYPKVAHPHLNYHTNVNYNRASHSIYSGTGPSVIVGSPDDHRSPYYLNQSNIPNKSDEVCHQSTDSPATVQSDETSPQPHYVVHPPTETVNENSIYSSKLYRSAGSYSQNIPKHPDDLGYQYSGGTISGPYVQSNIMMKHPNLYSRYQTSGYGTIGGGYPAHQTQGYGRNISGPLISHQSNPAKIYSTKPSSDAVPKSDQNYKEESEKQQVIYHHHNRFLPSHYNQFVNNLGPSNYPHQYNYHNASYNFIPQGHYNQKVSKIYHHPQYATDVPTNVYSGSNPVGHHSMMHPIVQQPQHHHSTQNVELKNIEANRHINHSQQQHPNTHYHPRYMHSVDQYYSMQPTPQSETKIYHPMYQTGGSSNGNPQIQVYQQHQEVESEPIKKGIVVGDYSDKNLIDLEDQINCSKILKTRGPLQQVDHPVETYDNSYQLKSNMTKGHFEYNYDAMNNTYQEVNHHHHLHHGSDMSLTDRHLSVREMVKGQNLRDFLATWNEDEDDEFGGVKRKKYDTQLFNRTDDHCFEPIGSVHLPNNTPKIHVGITVDSGTGNNSHNINLPDIIIDIEKPKILGEDTYERPIGTSPVTTTEKLYVLESIDVPLADLNKYKHLSVVNKLPDNIVQIAGDQMGPNGFTVANPTDENNIEIEESLKFIEEAESDRAKYFKNDFELNVEYELERDLCGNGNSIESIDGTGYYGSDPSINQKDWRRRIEVGRSRLRILKICPLIRKYQTIRQRMSKIRRKSNKWRNYKKKLNYGRKIDTQNRSIVSESMKRWPPISLFSECVAKLNTDEFRGFFIQQLDWISDEKVDFGQLNDCDNNRHPESSGNLGDIKSIDNKSDNLDNQMNSYSINDSLSSEEFVGFNKTDILTYPDKSEIIDPPHDSDIDDVLTELGVQIVDNPLPIQQTVNNSGFILNKIIPEPLNRDDELEDVLNELGVEIVENSTENTLDSLQLINPSILLSVDNSRPISIENTIDSVKDVEMDKDISKNPTETGVIDGEGEINPDPPNIDSESHPFNGIPDDSTDESNSSSSDSSVENSSVELNEKGAVKSVEGILESDDSASISSTNESQVQIKKDESEAIVDNSEQLNSLDSVEDSSISAESISEIHPTEEESSEKTDLSQESDLGEESLPNDIVEKESINEDQSKGDENEIDSRSDNIIPESCSILETNINSPKQSKASNGFEIKSLQDMCADILNADITIAVPRLIDLCKDSLNVCSLNEDNVDENEFSFVCIIDDDNCINTDDIDLTLQDQPIDNDEQIIICYDENDNESYGTPGSCFVDKECILNDDSLINEMNIDESSILWQNIQYEEIVPVNRTMYKIKTFKNYLRSKYLFDRNPTFAFHRSLTNHIRKKYQRSVNRKKYPIRSVIKNRMDLNKTTPPRSRRKCSSDSGEIENIYSMVQKEQDIVICKAIKTTLESYKALQMNNQLELDALNSTKDKIDFENSSIDTVGDPDNLNVNNLSNKIAVKNNCSSSLSKTTPNKKITYSLDVEKKIENDLNKIPQCDIPSKLIDDKLFTNNRKENLIDDCKLSNFSSYDIVDSDIRKLSAKSNTFTPKMYASLKPKMSERRKTISTIPTTFKTVVKCSSEPSKLISKSQHESHAITIKETKMEISPKRKPSISERFQSERSISSPVGKKPKLNFDEILLNIERQYHNSTKSIVNSTSNTLSPSKFITSPVKSAANPIIHRTDRIWNSKDQVRRLIIPKNKLLPGNYNEQIFSSFVKLERNTFIDRLANLVDIDPVRSTIVNESL